MEILTCPTCKNRLKTAKSLRFPDSKTVNCPSCDALHSLGQMRQRDKTAEISTILSVLEAPETQNRLEMTALQASLPPEPAVELPMPARFCQFCRREVPFDAAKCSHCSSWIDGKHRFHPGIAALLSFLFVGLGQFCQGRVLAGTLFLVFTLIGYCAFWPIGLAVHVAAIVNAAIYKP